jgi:hypothetical protein
VHPDEVHRQALPRESLEMLTPVAERCDIGLEAERLELGKQQGKLPLATSDGQSRAQDEDPGQPTAPS